MNRRMNLMFSFSKTTLKRQFCLIYVITILLPVTLIGLLLTMDATSKLHNHYEELLESDNLRVRSILFDVTTNHYNIVQQIMKDPSLIGILETHYYNSDLSHNTINNYHLLHMYQQNDTSIGSIRIYTNNVTIQDTMYFHPITDAIKNYIWYQKACITPGAFWMVTQYQDIFNNTYWLPTIYQKIPLRYGKDFAILSITVNSNYLYNRIDNNTLSTILSINKDPVFYNSNRNQVGLLPPSYIDTSNSYYSNSGIIEYKGDLVLNKTSTLTPYGSSDTIYISSFDSHAPKHIKNVIIGYSLLLLFCILIPSLIILIFSCCFLSRINTLRRIMQQVCNNNYEIIESIHGDDELYEIFTNLKIMVETIKEKESQYYKIKLNDQLLTNEQQKMEFKLLASQINPHFLYNTLETIRMQAFIHKDYEVANTIKLLGQSMRYLLSNTGTNSTSLDNEIAYTEMYITIQKLRFGDRINYELQVDPTLCLSEYKILPLLIQPVVENSIIHGLECADENSGLITIQINPIGNKLQLCIVDNGIGIEPQKLEHIQAHMESSITIPTTNIGLYNIFRRIKLCYGVEYGITIESTLGQGTTVTLTLPLIHN